MHRSIGMMTRGRCSSITIPPADHMSRTHTARIWLTRGSGGKSIHSQKRTAKTDRLLTPLCMRISLIHVMAANLLCAGSTDRICVLRVLILGATSNGRVFQSGSFRKSFSLR